MAKRLVNTQSWVGGLATDLKQGISASFADSQSIDFRKKPSQFTVLPGAQKASAGVVSGLMQNMVQTPDGTRYGIDNGGKFYKENTSGTWSVVGSVGSGAYGLVYRQDADSIYIVGTTTVSRYYPISNSPALQIDKYATSASTDTAASRSGGTQTATVASAVVDSPATQIAFAPDIEPLYSVKVNMVTVGTGTWTATIHDDANNVLGSGTLAAASATAGQLNEIVLSTPVRMLVKPNARTYHIHITNSNGSGTIACSKANDHSTADFQIVASRLINTNNGMHPAVLFQQYLCVGNERYVSVFEPLSDNPSNLEWLRHRLTFPPGYEVCGLAFTDEFLAIACEKRSTSATREFQDGKIFFWDGTSTTYNFFADVPEGAPYSLYSYENILYFVSGGALWANTGSKQNIKVRTLPNTDSEYSGIADYTVNYPNMMTSRRGVMLLGFASETSNRSLKHGVYSFGAVDKNYPKSFGYSYPISTGTTLNDGSNNLRIGMVKNFGDTLYISWRDGTTYGIDKIDNTSPPALSAYLEMLIWDGNAAYKWKEGNRMRVSFLPVPAGWTIRAKYKMDRQSDWQYGTPIGAGETAAYVHLPNNSKRFYEAQWGVDLSHDGTATTSPTGLGMTFEFDDLTDERDV